MTGSEGSEDSDEEESDDDDEEGDDEGEAEADKIEKKFFSHWFEVYIEMIDILFKGVGSSKKWEFLPHICDNHIFTVTIMHFHMAMRLFFVIGLNVNSFLIRVPFLLYYSVGFTGWLSDVLAREPSRYVETLGSKAR